MIITHDGRDWQMPPGFYYSFSEWYGDASDNIAVACTHVATFGTALQAGCHAGIWPWLLAKRFDHVMAFEPERENYQCAVVNLQECANVALSSKLLGDRIDIVPWHRDFDTGSHRVASQGAATMEMISIDSLALAGLDLICLDVEGYEPFVLMGAAATIARCRPVIMVERRGHEHFHGLPSFATDQSLQQLSYAMVGKSHYDCIYAPQERTGEPDDRR